MKGKTGSNLDRAIFEVWKREIGELSTRGFSQRLGAAKDIVLRFDVYRQLCGHQGCVNAVSFNALGDILVSGSDDMRVILWNWETGNERLSFDSGHNNNVFQARIMPCTDDRSIVTGAADGQVRHAQILESGRVETALLGKHDRRVHKLAIEPGSPHIFYSCGEDGLVQHFDLRTNAAQSLFTCHGHGIIGDGDDDMSFSSVINLNTIAIDPRNPNLFAVAGSSQYTRLYDIRKYRWNGSTDFDHPVDYFCPKHLINDVQARITGLEFSEQSEILVSYFDEDIYLFSKDMGLGPDLDVGFEMEGSENDEQDGPKVYKGHKNSETVKGVGFFGPKSDYVVSGSDCGRIFIWNKKDSELVRVMKADKYIVNCIVSHPHSAVLASSGIETFIKIWTPKSSARATLPENIGPQWRAEGRNWMHGVGTRDEAFRILSQRRWGGHLPEGQELLELILTFNAGTTPDSDGDDDDDDGGDDDDEDDDNDDDDEDNSGASVHDFFG